MIPVSGTHILSLMTGADWDHRHTPEYRLRCRQWSKLCNEVWGDLGSSQNWDLEILATWEMWEMETNLDIYCVTLMDEKIELAIRFCVRIGGSQIHRHIYLFNQETFMKCPSCVSCSLAKATWLNV